MSSPSKSAKVNSGIAVSKRYEWISVQNLLRNGNYIDRVETFFVMVVHCRRFNIN